MLCFAVRSRHAASSSARVRGAHPYSAATVLSAARLSCPGGAGQSLQLERSALNDGWCLPSYEGGTCDT